MQIEIHSKNESPLQTLKTLMDLYKLLGHISLKDIGSSNFDIDVSIKKSKT